MSLSHVIFCHILTHLVLQKDTRLVAALDAMRPYGFPQDLVELTVGELLNVGQHLFFVFYVSMCFWKQKTIMGFWVLAQVYGGNEGWVFIEDSSYSVLVETLLEKTNAPQDQEVKFIYLFFLVICYISIHFSPFICFDFFYCYMQFELQLIKKCYFFYAWYLSVKKKWNITCLGN